MYAMTLVCYLKDGAGTSKHRVRVLLDSGSDVTFIRKALYQKLGLRGQGVDLSVRGINGTTAHHKSDRVRLKLTAPGSDEEIIMMAYTKDKITNRTKEIKDDVLEETLEKLEAVPVDKGFNAGEVDILVGQGEMASIVKGFTPVTEKSCLQETKLGSVLMGPLSEEEVEVLAAEAEQD
jgi:hypothetical protein